MSRLHSLVGIPLLLCATSILAQSPTPVTFVDGGYPEMCEAAAKSLHDPSASLITGTRLGMPPLDICTLAIEAADSTLEQRAGSFNNRGVLKFDKQDYVGALADLDAAVQLLNTLAQAHANRGYVLVAQKRWQEAIAAFDQALTLGTDEQARVHFNRAGAHEELGHAREAYRDYLKASELQPEWEDPKRELTRFSVRR